VSVLEKYNESKILYSEIPENAKKIVFRKLEKLQTEIDKKDIQVLVKEFMAAVKEKRKEDVLMIYRDIKKIYHRLPRKYKNKVYEKVLPYLNQ